MEGLEAASGNQAFGLNEVDVMSLPQILDETPGKRYPARQATPATLVSTRNSSAGRVGRDPMQYRPAPSYRGKTELT